QTDPAGNVGVIDPETGYVYGSTQDEQALGQGFGTGISDFGGSTGSIDPETGHPVGFIADEPALGTLGGGGTGGSTTPSGGITTNSSWLTEAVGALPGDSSTIQTALASVLGGLTVTNYQKNLF